MSHDEIVRVLSHLYPSDDGLGTWNYDGDGASLEPVYDPEHLDDEGAPALLSLGLEWHRSDAAPTLEQIKAALSAVPIVQPEKPLEERIVDALEKLPPDQAVSAAELLTIIRG